MSQETKRILAHFLHLAGGGFFYLLPLLETRVLARTIGVVALGKVEFVKSITYYFFLIISYGFRYTAARHAARYKEDKPLLGQLISTVYALQLVGILIMGLLLGILVCWVPAVQAVKTYLWYYCVAMVGNMLCPVFVFQGLDKMRWMTYLNFLLEGIFLVGIILTVHTPADTDLYLMEYAITYLVRWLVALYWIYYSLGIPGKLPTQALIRLQLTEGLHVFFSRVLNTCYLRFPTFFLGLFVNAESVAVYAVGTRVLKITQHIIQHFTQAFFPVVSGKIAHAAGLRFFAHFALASVAVCMGVSVACYGLAPCLLQWIAGTVRPDWCWVLRVHAGVPCLVLLSNLLGMGVLVPMGAGWYYTGAMLLKSGGCMVLYSLVASRLQVQLASFIMLGSEVFATVGLAGLVYQKVVRKGNTSAKKKDKVPKAR